MINLMYIVLTAMLALNVSAEILNAFKTVNESIGRSNTSITDKNNIIYQQFAKQMEVDPQRTAPLKKAAETVKKQSADMYNYIETLKEEIIRESGGRDADSQIAKIDNLDAASRVMENRKRGPELQRRLEQFREALLKNYTDPAQRQMAEKTFPLTIEMPAKTQKKTWTQAHFDMVPTIAAVTILSKFQNDVKNAEAQVIDDLYKRINAQQFTFDTYTPLVSASSGYVMNGQAYEAKIMLGAYSSTVNPTITVNGQPVPVENGVGTYKINASGIGEHTYNVAVALKEQSGQEKTFTTSGTYMVGASSVSVSADKMNVLIAGLDNPVSVAAAGVQVESVSASITGGSLSKTGAGHYVARVPASLIGKNVQINVSANIGGATKNMGAMTFRVGRLPDPVPEVGGSNGGQMSAAAFRVQKGVAATLKDFYFDAKFVVTSFRMGFSGTGFPDYLEKVSGSAYFTSDMQQLMSRCRPGTRVYIDDIRAKGPDGLTRKLPSINFRLN
ncbi:gliding motility protein GldM [Compostibacter hankyongensis]|uniref:Gliding motility protein GldM n=2 Tax=Compostibacter hankyongensis TaxID=1007089 RepID=A0ABP8FE69_9BACT